MNNRFLSYAIGLALLTGAWPLVTSDACCSYQLTSVLPEAETSRSSSDPSETPVTKITPPALGSQDDVPEMLKPRSVAPESSIRFLPNPLSMVPECSHDDSGGDSSFCMGISSGLSPGFISRSEKPGSVGAEFLRIDAGAAIDMYLYKIVLQNLVGDHCGQALLALRKKLTEVIALAQKDTDLSPFIRKIFVPKKAEKLHENISNVLLWVDQTVTCCLFFCSQGQSHLNQQAVNTLQRWDDRVDAVSRSLSGVDTRIIASLSDSKVFQQILAVRDAFVLHAQQTIAYVDVLECMVTESKSTTMNALLYSMVQNMPKTPKLYVEIEANAGPSGL